MKKLFMVEFDLPEILEEDFVNKIPAQRIMVDKLMSSGVVKAYSLATDRSRLWVIMAVESEFEIMEAIARFPLIDHMEPFISELAFHNTEEQVMQFSLN